MNIKCTICNNESNFLLAKDGFDLYRCGRCGLVFVHPLPDGGELAALYSAESGYQANRAEDLSKVPEVSRAKVVFGFLQKIKSEATILDVGCSGGHFMYWARKRGFKPSGVELNKRTADSAAAHGFVVFNGLISDATFKPESFDVIFLGEIIEHVRDPRQFIRDCSKFLKEGGLMIITTPNLDCFWSKSTFLFYKFFGIPWSSVTPPYHLHQFSSSNLDLLLEQEGFKFEGENYILMTRLKYELGMLHLVKKFKNSKKISDLLFVTFSFSLYILAYFIHIILSPFFAKDFNMIKIYRK